MGPKAKEPVAGAGWYRFLGAKYLGNLFGRRDERPFVDRRVTEDQCIAAAAVGVEARQWRSDDATSGGALRRLIVRQSFADFGRKVAKQMHARRIWANGHNLGQMLLRRFDQRRLPVAVNRPHPADVRRKEAFAYERIDDGLRKDRRLRQEIETNSGV